MVVGETGVGKSTWIHAFLNYMQGIQIEENIRYLLFDEKEKQNKFAEKHFIWPIGWSITDIPQVYNIQPTVLFNNSIRLIDTPGYGDTRGKEFDQKITEEIQKLFEGENIEESDNKDKIDKLNAICIIFKASETRYHERINYILKQIFHLFGNDIRNNIIIIFIFADSFTIVPTLNSLKCELSLFKKFIGNIENIPHFTFNNLAYFSDDRDYFRIQYEKNKINFGNFCKCILSLKSISLEKNRKVMYLRGHIYNLASKIKSITEEVNSSLKYKDNFNKINQKIYSDLLAGINCLYDLSKKNDELDRIALLFDYQKYEKYGYIRKILKEKMTEKNDISSFFEDSLRDIDNICLSETSKDKKIRGFIKLLLRNWFYYWLLLIILFLISFPNKWNICFKI